MKIINKNKDCINIDTSTINIPTPIFRKGEKLQRQKYKSLISLFKEIQSQ